MVANEAQRANRNWPINHSQRGATLAIAPFLSIDRIDDGGELLTRVADNLHQSTMPTSVHSTLRHSTKKSRDRDVKGTRKDRCWSGSTSGRCRSCYRARSYMHRPREGATATHTTTPAKPKVTKDIFPHHFLSRFRERESDVDDDARASVPLFPLMY